MQNIDYLLKNEFSTFWLNFIVFNDSINEYDNFAIQLSI